MVQKYKKTESINLKSYNLSESDKIIVMYSKENGLIKAVAKGCKKPKSKLGARMDLLVANSLMISEGKNLYTICEAKTINSFKNIRENIEKLMFSSYIAEIITVFGIENDLCSQKIYDILYGALNKISESNNIVETLIAVMKFQLKLMQIVGFGVELESCLCCQKELKKDDIYFSITKGGIVCKDCLADNFAIIKMNHKIRDFLISILNTDFNDQSEYEIKATEKVCRVCFDLLKNYIQFHCSKKIKTVELLETACN